MTDYKCGHKTKGIIIMDNNIFSLIHYIVWAEGVGVSGTKEKCFDCWNKELDEKIKNSYKTLEVEK